MVVGWLGFCWVLVWMVLCDDDYWFIMTCGRFDFELSVFLCVWLLMNALVCCVEGGSLWVALVGFGVMVRGVLVGLGLFVGGFV